MSFDALAWAARQNPGSAGAKLVLFGLAECAGRDDACAWPSIAALVEFSSLDRKTVISNLRRLEDAAPVPYIVDSGERRGKTAQVKVYRLVLDRDVQIAAANASADVFAGRVLVNEMRALQGLESVPESEGFRNRNGSAFDAERVPETGHGISKGISHSLKVGDGRIEERDGLATFVEAGAVYTFPPGVTFEGLCDWAAVRKAAHKPLTPGSVREGLKTLFKLQSEGEDVAAVVSQTVEMGYLGFFAVKEGRDNGRRGDKRRGRASDNGSRNPMVRAVSAASGGGAD